MNMEGRLSKELKRGSLTIGLFFNDAYLLPPTGIIILNNN
jgi:hypothetical protein